MKTIIRMLCAVCLATFGLPGCSRQTETAVVEPPSLNVTDWTDKTELYMEYPPLAAGQIALFAVHLTNLNDFKPITAGQASVEFSPESGGQAQTITGPPPSRPGAFRVEGNVPPAGRYRWALLLDSPDLTDRHDLGVITVYDNEKAAADEAQEGPGDDPAAIAYLKEQQWTNDFATEPVREADVRVSTRVPATVHPLPGGEAVVAAPAAGRFVAQTLPSIGDQVRVDAVLGRLEPRLTTSGDRATLAADMAEAQATLDAARVEQSRAEGLLAENAVPARRVEDARRMVTVAEARLQAAEARLAQRDETLRVGGGAASGNAFVLRAPIAGRITETMATLGASYDEGAPLFKIARTDAVELEVHVPAAQTALVRNLTGVALEIPGQSDPLSLRFHHIHDPGVLDEKTKALPVQMEVDNSERLLLIGQSATAILYSGGTQRVTAVPKDAVLMEAGRPYVFVQIGGERFARRFIDIITRDGDLVGIRTGLKPGDRVVTRGAYDVQLASAAKGLPAEGHVH